MDYIVEKPKSIEDHERAKEFLSDHFHPNMPLTNTFDVKRSPPPNQPKPAGDSQDCHGDIVGAAINRHNIVHHLDPDTPPEKTKTKDYRVEKAKSMEDHERVKEFLSDHFHQEMPLGRAFNVTVSSPPNQPKPTGDSQDFTVMAVDCYGSVVGAAINKHNIVYHFEPDTPPEKKKMMEFMQWAEKDADLASLPEKTIELRVLSVHREWRQRGISRSLAEESVKLARESGYQAMRICCASEYTARLARSLGWREHYKLRYTDYPARAGTDVCIKPVPPHEYLYYYVTYL